MLCIICGSPSPAPAMKNPTFDGLYILHCQSKFEEYFGLLGWLMIRTFSNHELGLIQAFMPNNLWAVMFILTVGILIAILWIIPHYNVPARP